MKFKLRGSTNLLKIVLALGISVSLWNCEKEEYYEQNQPEFKIKNAATVSFQDAIKHFELNKKNYEITNLALRGSDTPFKVTPDWNTFEHKKIAYTDALLTTAKTEINRTGKYYSKLYFLNVNGTIRNVIFTTYIKKANAVGGIVDASVFFNKINGEFIDGYKIEYGKFTKKYILKETETQKANLLSLFMFFQDAGDDEFWCNDGPLDEVDLGTIGSSSGSLTTPGNESGGGFSTSYLWYITSGPGSYSYSSYINGATGSGISMPTGGGSTDTDNSLSGGQIDAVAGAILVVLPIDPDENGNCPEGYVKNPKTGQCEYVCGGGKTFNSLTEKCECPEGTMENQDGLCVTDCAPNCIDQTNCVTRTGLLHDANFLNGNPKLGNNVTISSDNFRDDSWVIIQDTNCGNGKIPKGSNVNVLSTTPVVRTLSNGTKLNYYRVEYSDCPKGNNKTNGNFDQNKPCSDCFKGNPVKGNMQVAKQSVSGIGGGLYGNSHRKKWKKGADGKYIKDSNGKRKLFPKWHRGIDIVTQKGDPIYAMFDGKAIKSGSNNEAAGFYIKIESNINGKTILSYYFHMENETRISGDVKAGDIIGYQGDSGNLKNEIKKGTVPCHVHIKIKENGITVNPDDYIKGTINTTTGAITADCD